MGFSAIEGHVQLLYSYLVLKVLFWSLFCFVLFNSSVTSRLLCSKLRFLGSVTVLVSDSWLSLCFILSIAEVGFTSFSGRGPIPWAIWLPPQNNLFFKKI